MYNPILLSNNFLERSFKEKAPVSPMKMQKMLYFLYRDYLQKTDKPLFSERFLPWKYGPVLDSVYHEYREYGSNRIAQYGGRKPYMIDEGVDADLAEVISALWDRCRNISAVRLSELTHSEGGAWRKAYLGRMPFLADEDIMKDRTVIPYGG